MPSALRAPNGVVHRVDVSSQIVLIGVNVLWIAECKLWNRAVPKEKVSALKGIVSQPGTAGDGQGTYSSLGIRQDVVVGHGERALQGASGSAPTPGRVNGMAALVSGDGG